MTSPTRTPPPPSRHATGATTTDPRPTLRNATSSQIEERVEKNSLARKEADALLERYRAKNGTVGGLETTVGTRVLGERFSREEV